MEFRGAGMNPPRLWGGRCAVQLRTLTFLVHQKLIEMAQSFETEALDGPVRVLAQDAQHGHQLPDPCEVLLGLCREHGMDIGLPTASHWLLVHPGMASTEGSLASLW